MPFLIRIYRTVIPLLALAAIVAQAHETIVVKQGSAANFFSYFTIHSNLLAITVLLWAAWWSGSAPVLRDVLRGAATLYLSITGVVYSVLLAEEEARLQLIIPWVDVVLHRLTPLVMIIDWLVNPPAVAPARRHALQWMIYPLAFMVYTVIRGPLVGWYPYPFLDPARVGGGQGVALYCVGITVVAMLFASVVVVLGRWQGRRQHDDDGIAEARRRAQELDEDPSSARSWEEIKRELDR